jgi:hypothetical protein
MLIIKLSWWLWNQMFQYAYIKALSLRTWKDFFLDVSSYKNYFRPFELEIFDIQKKYATKNQLSRYEKLHSSNKYLNHVYFKIREFVKKHNKSHYIENNLQFDKKFLSITDGYIEWYFQSEKYFLDYEDEIRKDLTFIYSPSPKNLKTINIVQTTNSVSIHIRRGDYLKGNNINYHGICSLEYYKQAIAYIRSKINNPQFFFFSDDIQWVKENLKTWNNNDIYIDWNTWNNSREDMRLMSLCKHNIIANSSFSRRGAWLNNNKEKIVIAPKNWISQWDKHPDIFAKWRIKL